MSVTTTVAPATVAPAPVVPAPVAPATMSNGDAKPSAPVNVEAVQAAWLKAEAHELDRQITALVANVGRDVEALGLAIHEADTKKVWRTLGYRNLKLWIDEQIGDALAQWSPSARRSLSAVLRDKGFSGADVARMTGTSEATASRDAAKATGADAKPSKPSTATDRAVKTLETVAGACGDVDKYATADLKRLHAELLRTVALVGDELAKRSGTTLPRSGAIGTTSTGVNAPKPSPKPSK